MRRNIREDKEKILRMALLASPQALETYNLMRMSSGLLHPGFTGTRACLHAQRPCARALESRLLLSFMWTDADT